jgi:MMP 1-O-methyltransferase
MTPELASALDGVEGFLSPDEPQFLHDLAAQVPPGQCIVEIGSYRGRSTIALALGAQDGVIVYAVDPHEEHVAGGYPFGMADNAAFMKNVSQAGVGHKIRVWNMSSKLANHAWQQTHWNGRYCDPTIGLLWIDGAHEYETVNSDTAHWCIYVPTGGLLALHDSTGTWEGPTKVADELARHPQWTELPSFGFTRVFRKEAS